MIWVWIAVKPEILGDMKIPHGVGGEIWWHPCLFGLVIGGDHGKSYYDVFIMLA